ncbi:microsomal glutathione s-transferase 3 [Quercus suber]|uniref:Microsomal glutathione s-transferase 3 n=1 Tax=Quercus suber TaxID=58331 RepID=A0AAW0KXL2_QUESU
MAGVELLLPKEYGYVAFVLVFDCLSNLWMAAQVGKARKRFKVPYPTLYALESENKDAKLFNCVQVFPIFYTSIICSMLEKLMNF